MVRQSWTFRGFLCVGVLLSTAVTSRAENPAHPLMPVLKMANDGLAEIDREIHDYSCLLVKRERVDGKMSDYQHIRAKIRHEKSVANAAEIPFSVFLQFLGPDRFKGREVLFVRGERNGDLLARRGGRRMSNMTLQLDPLGPLAMDGNRYPITEIGIKNLVRRLISVVEEDIKHGECDVKFFKDAKIKDRLCTHIQVTHPERRDHFRYHIARVFIDKELNVPVYYASYTWPKEPGGKPLLMEEYIYTDLKVNVGLTDKDFRSTHPDYHFRERRDGK